jgi:heme-degrading monooxygenase HmoA
MLGIPAFANLLPVFTNDIAVTVLALRQISIMQKNFVAINYISCTPEYRERFEELFGSRAKAIDLMPGFVDMQVLQPAKPEDPYLIVSYWETEDAFKTWTRSEAFLEGHRRGFADLAKAKEEGRPAPMHSDFKTYKIIAN